MSTEPRDGRREGGRVMFGSCDLCGDKTDETYRLALAWPAEDPEDFDDPAEFDDPGEGALDVCADCADGVATDILVSRAVTRGLDDVYAGLGDQQAVATDGGRDIREPADMPPSERPTETVPVEVSISAEVWERIREGAVHKIVYGDRDPELAFYDALYAAVKTEWTVTVDGETKTPADIRDAVADQEGGGDE